MYQYGYQVPKERKVVIYARVSTEHEAQLSALENQKDWYKSILEQHPEWEVMKMYVDEGITGTSAKKRPQFMQMIKDAGNGKFDLILTREVSRFARNTVDTLQYTRSLKSKGVEVFFINDNIKTFDGDGELRLTIMATLAQDESRKTSIRVKSGQQTSMENGVFYGNGNILGYNRVGRDMVINPEQAKTVRMIYDWYLEGNGIRSIQFKLEQAGRLTATGKKNWYVSCISRILQNSFYCGIITYHKEYVPDFLEQKKIRNFGDIKYTKVRGTHEPIISVEDFELVQKKMANKRETLVNNISGKRISRGIKPPTDVWTDILLCECGHKFNRKIWHKTKDGIQYAYQCYSSLKTGTIGTRVRKGLSTEGICRSPMIPRWKLQLMAKHIFQKYITNTDEILSIAESMLAKHINDTEPIKDNTEIIEKKKSEQEKLNKRLNVLIEMRADGEITKDEFKASKEEIENSLKKVQDEIEHLQPKKKEENEITYKDKIEVLKYYLRKSVISEDNEDLSDSVIKAFISKVIVHENGFDWYLRFNSDDETSCFLNVEGRGKKNSFVSEQQRRLRLTKERIDLSLLNKVNQSNFVKVWEFAIDSSEAKAYLHAYSAKSRVRKWNDLNISVFL